MADDKPDLYCAPCVHFTGTACDIDKALPEDILRVVHCNFLEKKRTPQTPTTSSAATARASGDFVPPDQMLGDAAKKAKTTSDSATVKASGNAPASEDKS